MGKLVQLLSVAAFLTTIAVSVNGKDCTTEEFHCNGGTCIPLVQVCDTVMDCPSAEDEVNCRSIGCPETLVKCFDGCRYECGTTTRLDESKIITTTHKYDESNTNNSCCEPGWLRFTDKCYMFSHTASTWGEAEGTCLGFHAKLAEPMTQDESSFLISHSQNLHGTFWLGISDLIEEDRWIYSSNMQPIRVNNFQPGEPNQHTTANCVAIWNIFHGKWADEPCSNRYQFICEIPNESDGSEVIG